MSCVCVRSHVQYTCGRVYCLCVYMCMYVYIYIYIYTYIYTYIYVYIYIHTHSACNTLSWLFILKAAKAVASKDRKGLLWVHSSRRPLNTALCVICLTSRVRSCFVMSCPMALCYITVTHQTISYCCIELCQTTEWNAMPYCRTAIFSTRIREFWVLTQG